MRTLIATAIAALALLVVPATSTQASTLAAKTPITATLPVADAGKTPTTEKTSPKAGTQDFQNCGCGRYYRVRYYRVRYHRVRYYRVRYAVRYTVRYSVYR